MPAKWDLMIPYIICGPSCKLPQQAKMLQMRGLSRWFHVGEAKNLLELHPPIPLSGAFNQQEFKVAVFEILCL